MPYFVVQVLTRGEDKFLSLAREELYQAGFSEEWDAKLLFPRRRLVIRKQGRKRESLAPIFPGYIFLDAQEIPPRLHWTLRRTPGFVRFLESNHDVRPLAGRDRDLLLHFLRFGEVVERSTVTFDEDKRIQVIDGPLKGLEGSIVKVDKRKGRAKIRLDMYEDSFLVDLGFETIGAAGKES